MYAHERSLVKRLENKPFALLGINSDPKDVVKKGIKDENLSWRSWWRHQWSHCYQVEREWLADDLCPR